MFLRLSFFILCLGSTYATSATNQDPSLTPKTEVAKSSSAEHWDSPDTNTEKKPAPTESEKTTHPPKSSQRKNRLTYVALQTGISTYVYGSAIPWAFGVEETKIHVAMPLLVAPLAFGSHFYFAKSNDFEESHLLGTSYLSIAMLYTIHALAFSTISSAKTAHRTASIAALGLYPLSIWGGYELGNQYIDLPGRIETQYKFALGFGLLGLLTPLLYFENTDKHGDLIWRIGLAQGIGMAGLGHVVSSYYRVGENIPAGVSTGIVQHSILGAIAGLEVAALSDASSVRPWLGAALLGGTLGFTEGLFYYRDKYDTKERAFYNGLGALGGTLMGTGILVLAADTQASDYSQKILFASLLGGGAWLGYWVTNFMTSGMEEKTSSLKESSPSHWSFIPLPMPEPRFAGKQMYMQYRVPGLTVTF